MRKAYKYYVVSCGDKVIEICNNLLLLLMNFNILWRAIEAHCFQEVRRTRNIMHETFSRDRMSRKVTNPYMLWL